MTDFAGLLKETMGLDAASIGVATVDRAVQERLVACGLTDRNVYWDRVRASAGELQRLIDAVVIPETWFFRDPEAFAALAGPVQSEWRQTHPEGEFRMLSLPCSTGEEAYAMAMALLDAGFPAGRFTVDAVDISERNLARAERAVYGRIAFRSHDLSFRDRFFEPVSDGHRLADTVRRQVRLHQTNLFTVGSLPSIALYDVIFCRNLLIYFDPPTQARAIAILANLLAPDGYLFLGSAESAVLSPDEFTSMKMPLAFAFRRASRRPAKRTARPPLAPRKPQPPAAVIARPAPPPLTPMAGNPTRDAPAPRIDALADAAAFADRGCFPEAIACCEQYIHKHGPSARVVALIGLVRDAAGDVDQAEAFYRKALYLDPAHAETLAHLALLMDRQGRTAEARVLRDRLDRAALKSGALA